MKKLLCLLVMLLIITPALAEISYEEAVKLMESEQYEEAYLAFKELGDVEDSKKLASECKKRWTHARYEQAHDLYDAEQYGEAYAIFADLGDYRESKRYAERAQSRYNQAEYKRADALFDEAQYEEALVIFEALGRYQDSRDRVKETQEKIAEVELAAYEQASYEQGLELLAQERWQEARDAFIQAGSFEGATEKLYEALRGLALVTVAAEAEEALALGSYREAMYFYLALGDEVKAESCREKVYGAAQPTEDETKDDIIGHAKALKQLWKIDEANELLAPLGEYRDADLLIDPVTYMIPAVRLRDDNTTEKSEVFTAPDGTRHQYQIFKGVHKWVEARTFCEMLGGHLATLTSEEENQFVHGFMTGSGFTTAYFGLSDERRVGNWIWVTGEPFEYTNWDPGEPSYSGTIDKERYGMYFYKHTKGTWNDAHFYENDKVDPGCSFICEWDLEE